MAVYATSDWHGYKDCYIKIKEFIKPEDTVYFLGDACDRGLNGYWIIKQLLQDRQFIYLKGNHEQLFADAMQEYLAFERFDNKCILHMMNGGDPTFTAWERDRMPYGLNKILYKLPIMDTYINKNNEIIRLCHAGYNGKIPTEEKQILWNRKHLNNSHWDGKDNEYVVFGHTPVQVIDVKLNKHKIDIDYGTYNSYKTCLIDLDNLSNIIYFEV